MSELACDGYIKLLGEVMHDEEKWPGFHDYRAKLAWVVERARHYADKAGLTPEAVIDAWERQRDYWYMNYYQDCNQPLLEDGAVRVFDTVDDMLASIGKTGFRCPCCAGVSLSPYECDTGVLIPRNGGEKPCDWKVYGLFGHMGKGVSVFVKDRMRVEKLFMPVAWEKPA